MTQMPDASGPAAGASGAPTARRAGVVRALFIKPARAMPLEAVGTQTLRSAYGVSGDCNADPESTRQVLLVSRNALNALDLGPGALRENILVEGLNIDRVPSGTVLEVGSARLRVTFPCDPCALLRRYAGLKPAEAHGRRGVLAVVIGGGEVSVGDRIVELGQSYTALPDDWRERIRWFLSRMPPDQVTTYEDVVKAVGQPPRYVRAMPHILSAPEYADLPTERVITAEELDMRQGAGGARQGGVTRWKYWEAVYERSPGG